MNSLGRPGIGMPYFPDVPDGFYKSGVIDFVEVTPEILCMQRRSGRLDIDGSRLDKAKDACAGLPISVHGVELSIGSSIGQNEHYLAMLDHFAALWPFEWHSEHLAFQTVPGADAHSMDTGVPLPVPPLKEAVELVAPRCAAIRERYGKPFLLENSAHYLRWLPTDDDIGSEEALMNEILMRSECHQLLDLHNIWCNAVNLGQDPFEMLSRVDLSRVVEIHLAGGREEAGLWTDSHTSRAPSEVWDLLEWTVPKTPLLRGVVFEALTPNSDGLGPDILLLEAEKAATILGKVVGKADFDPGTKWG